MMERKCHKFADFLKVVAISMELPKTGLPLKNFLYWSKLTAAFYGTRFMYCVRQKKTQKIHVMCNSNVNLT